MKKIQFKKDLSGKVMLFPDDRHLRLMTCIWCSTPSIYERKIGSEVIRFCQNCGHLWYDRSEFKQPMDYMDSFGLFRDPYEEEWK